MTTTPNQEQYYFSQAGEHIIRHGEAAPLREPKALTYSGRLDAPRQFLDKKLLATLRPVANKAYASTKRYDPQDATFVVDKGAGTVTLTLNEWDTPSDSITGKLEMTPDLLAFGINDEGKLRSPKDLWKFLKPRGYFFADQEKYREFLGSLSNFNVKVSRATEQRHDNAGNKKEAFERVVQENSLSNNPFFKLEIPLYKGYEKRTFQVELGFDPTDAGVSIFLLSDELYKLLLDERDALLQAEVDYFASWGCSVITKS